ncbi:MAG: aminotransferase, partial [Proteobacteria bacterium]
TTPHNPTGKVFTRVELESIAQLCREYDIACVTDEVYEYLTYDGREHLSIATLPGMAERTITMGSYSKTFAITGWRIGYLVSPPSTHELLKTIADQMFVCTPIPLQHGVACGITELGPEFYSSMLSGYTRKRGIISKALLKAGFPHEPPQGAYYLTAETTERFPGQTSEQVVDILIEKAHVAGVPASDFLGPEVKGDPSRSNFIRFSFAVPDEMLERAAKGLERL